VTIVLEASKLEVGEQACLRNVLAFSILTHAIHKANQSSCHTPSSENYVTAVIPICSGNMSRAFVKNEYYSSSFQQYYKMVFLCFYPVSDQTFIPTKTPEPNCRPEPTE
jgi:hypothetical protein